MLRDWRYLSIPELTAFLSFTFYPFLRSPLRKYHVLSAIYFSFANIFARVLLSFWCQICWGQHILLHYECCFFRFIPIMTEDGKVFLWFLRAGIARSLFLSHIECILQMHIDEPDLCSSDKNNKICSTVSFKCLNVVLMNTEDQRRW